eukprot:tig00001181_g7435.t1
MRRPALAFALLIVAVALVYRAEAAVQRTPASPEAKEVVEAREFALAEIRKLCAYCSEAWDQSYRNLAITQIHSVETAPSAFRDGQNYFFKLDLETKEPGTYKGTHSVIVFSKEDGGYKGISIDEFPQINYEEVYPL